LDDVSRELKCSLAHCAIQNFYRTVSKKARRCSAACVIHRLSRLRGPCLSRPRFAGLALNPGFGVGRMRSADSSDDAAYLAFRERLCHGLCLAGVQER
jgi:hypothetical protein